MLRTVRVPDKFAPIFERAQEYVGAYFSKERRDAERGTVEIFGERYVLLRASAMSVEFFEVVQRLYRDKDEREALSVARSLLFDLAHAMGFSDALSFAAKMGVSDPIERLSAGPIHFSHAGWAFVDILPESRPSPDENYFLIYDHPYSFESDSWLKAGKSPDFPVCIMNAGYSSGWCEASFGLTLVSTEILCKAQGDDRCRFIMAPPNRIEGHIAAYCERDAAGVGRTKKYEIPGFFSRKKAEDELLASREALRRANEELERRVAERTAELVEINARLTADIAERQKAEAALLASREMNARIIEALPGGIVHVGKTGEILHANPEVERLSGLTLTELKSQRAGDLAGATVWEDGTPAEPEDYPAMVAIRTGERQGPVTMGVRNSAGETTWAVFTAVPIRDPSTNEITGAFSTFVDTTEQKRRDEERKKLESTLQQTQRLESLGVLAGGIAHEFNNLLVGVLGNAALARESLPESSPALARMDQIEDAARRASDLTRQMLAYSGKGRVQMERIDLSALLDEMTPLLVASIPKNIELSVQLERGLGAIDGDKAQVRQVFTNLILNGAEAVGKAPGVVTIRTGQTTLTEESSSAGGFVGNDLVPGSYVFAEVSDTGTGMTAETLERIFEPFFSTKFSGRGLGLAAALGIIRGHRGAARVRSALGEGSTFCVYFPTVRGAPSEPVRQATSESVTRGAGTILVVDDEPMVCNVIERTLRALGYTVVTAHDGARAVSVFGASPDRFSAVILDLTMPRMGGAEAMEKIRAIRSDVPIILSSGFNAEDAAGRVDTAHIAGFLEKPYTPGELRKMLEAALGRR